MAMASQEIYTQLTEVFRDLFDDDAIVLTPETTAADIPGWNSLMHVNLILSAEIRFKINFKTSEVEALHSVGHLADLIEMKLVKDRRVAHA
jgi:acyl carrier protein